MDWDKLTREQKILYQKALDDTECLLISQYHLLKFAADMKMSTDLIDKLNAAIKATDTFKDHLGSKIRWALKEDEKRS